MRNRPVCLYSGGPQARTVFVRAGLCCPPAPASPPASLTFHSYQARRAKDFSHGA